MIDTIAVAIRISDLVPEKVYYENRHWRGWDVRMKGNFPVHYRNPTREEEAEGCCPRLTGYVNRNDQFEWVKIEFSAPKLVLGNNLDELDAGEFENVLDTLTSRLQIMGFTPNYEALKKGKVMRVDFSKNMELVGGYRITDVLSQLKKINITKRLQDLDVRYKNSGSSLVLGTKSYSISLYDKVKEVAKSMGRDYVEGVRDRQVLRYEVRLYKAKLNAMLLKLGYDKDPTLSDLFTTEMSRDVLVHFWDTMIERDAIVVFGAPLSPLDFLRALFLSEPTIKAKEGIYRTGLVTLARDKGGINEMRRIIEPRIAQGTWYRFLHHLRTASLGANNVILDDWYWQLHAQLHEFKPMRLLQELQQKIT